MTRYLPTPPWAVFGLVGVWLLLTQRHAMVSGDSDAVFHVLLGQLMWQRGGLLPSDPTTLHQPDHAFILHEWGFELLLAPIYGVAGLSGVAVAGIALVAATLAVLTAWLQRQGVGLVVGFVSLSAAASTVWIHLHMRPHLVSWLFSVAWLVGLEQMLRGHLDRRRWLAMSAVAIVVWTNLHGGFAYAFVLLVGAIAAALVDLVQASDEPGRDAAIRQTLFLAGSGLLFAALSLLNPWGPALHLHILSFAGGSEALALVTDLAPPNLRERPHLLLYLLGVFAVLVAGRERPATRDWVMTLVLVAVAFQSVRNFAMLGLLAMVYAGPRLQLLVNEAREQTGWLGDLARLDRPAPVGTNRVASAAMLVVVVALGLRLPTEARGLPVAAVDHVQAHPEAFAGPVFNRYEWGGYLAFRRFPPHRVYINSWIDHHGVDQARTYRRVLRAQRGWRSELNEAGVQWVLLRPTDPLVTVLADEGWTESWRDQASIILLRP